MRAAVARPTSRTSSWLSGSPVMPAAEVGDQGDAEHLGAGLAGGDGLQRGGHAHQVAAEDAAMRISAGVS